MYYKELQYLGFTLSDLKFLMYRPTIQHLEAINLEGTRGHSKIYKFLFTNLKVSQSRVFHANFE